MQFRFNEISAYNNDVLYCDFCRVQQRKDEALQSKERLENGASSLDFADPLANSVKC